MCKLEHLQYYNHYDLKHCFFCDTCLLAKIHHLPFIKSEYTSCSLFELLHLVYGDIIVLLHEMESVNF